MRSSLVIAAACLLFCGSSQAEEANKASPLPVVFDETYAEPPFGRFRSTRSGESEWSKDKHWILKSGSAFVRPEKAGRTAELAIHWEFPPLAKDGDKAETRVGWVFADSQIGMVAFARERQDGKTVGTLRLLRLNESPQPEETVLRTHRLEGDLVSGNWTLSVRHGACCIKAGDEELLCGVFPTGPAPILGVTLAQEHGTVASRRLTFRSEAFPDTSPETVARIQHASALNEKAKQLFVEKQFAESEKLMAEALAAFRKAHGGDDHIDVTNALYNMATILRKADRRPEAVKFFEEAIGLRQKLLGPDHPLTAQLQMELASLLAEGNQLPEAFRPCLSANMSFHKFYGPDDPRTQVLQKLLDRLPPPK